jgi:hypothetical protein
MDSDPEGLKNMCILRIRIPNTCENYRKNIGWNTWAVCGGEDAEHDVLVERALEVSAQAVQHAVIRHAEVQHLGTTVRVLRKKFT